MPIRVTFNKGQAIANVSAFLFAYARPVMQNDNGPCMHHPTDRTPSDPLSFEA